jgi:hypothetical protein
VAFSLSLREKIDNPLWEWALDPAEAPIHWRKVFDSPSGCVKTDAKSVGKLRCGRIQQKVSSVEWCQESGGKFVSLSFIAPDCGRNPLNFSRQRAAVTSSSMV